MLIIGIVILIAGFIILARFNNPRNEDSDLTIPITINEFRNKIDDQDSFILVVVNPDCPACEIFKPILNKVIEEYDLNIYSINVAVFNEKDFEYFSDIVGRVGTPTTIFFADGEEVTTLNRIIGSVSESDLINRLKALNYID